MPSKTKTKNAAIAAKTAALPSIPKELIEQFVKGPMTAQAVNAASMAFKKALIERALGAELGHHLGQGEERDGGPRNHRNGVSAKTVVTDEGPVRIDVPRDRQGSFEPLLIPKHERRFTGFDDKIIAMNARPLPERRRSEQTDLAGAAQHHRRLEPCQPGLERGHEPVRHPLRRTLHEAHAVR